MANAPSSKSLTSIEMYEHQWHLHGRSHDGQVDPRASIRCEEAWALAGYGSPEIVVALVDDGCDVENVALRGARSFAGAICFRSGSWYFDEHFESYRHSVNARGSTHGTSMATLIAGTGEGGTRGVVPNCRLLPVRLPMQQGSITLSDHDLLALLELISDHADIAVMSWSRLPIFIPSRQVIDRWRFISEYGGRRATGLLSVVPAGNSNCPIAWQASEPIPYTLSYEDSDGSPKPLASRTFRNLLTDIPNVLHISAISSTAQRSLYSCYGPGIDLCAPSSSSRVFTGAQVEGTRGGLTTSYGPNGEITHAFKGTSGAAALVGGVAALTLSANLALGATELSQILTSSANRELDIRNPHLNLTDPLPWEMPPIAPFDSGAFNQEGWSPWFGYGLVDAYSALCAARAALG